MVPSAAAWLILLVLPVVRSTLTTDPTVFTNKQYDYLVVGGGTAGLAVAARLSEDVSITVGVIEAGPYLPDDPLINIPGNFGSTQGNAKYDWLLETVPQSQVNGRNIQIPRGKVLGGSSALNYMAYGRPSKGEFDVWSVFATGWNWKSFLPYLKAAETYLAPRMEPPFGNAVPNPPTSAEGTSGPVKVSLNEWYSDVTAPFVQALKGSGVYFNPKPDDGNATGLTNTAVSVDRPKGVRSYSANTYFARNSERTNFVVLTGGEATKILLTPTDGGLYAASGVKFLSGGKSYQVLAKREVILSAGSLKTPQLLELSGIGNKAILAAAGISKTLIELPGVGENLQDHIYIASSFELKPGHHTFDEMRNNPAFAAQQAAQYAKNHTGILAATHSAFAFVGTNNRALLSKAQLTKSLATLAKEVVTSPPSLLSAVQYAIQSKWFRPDSNIGNVEMIMVPGLFTATPPTVNASYISLLAAIQHPYSRGNIHINSSDPTAKPVMDTRTFSRTIDLDMLVRGSQWAQKIAQTEPLKSIIAARHDPSPEVASDAQFAEYVKTYVESVYHPIGTAALAPRKLGGVVGSDLKVYGTSNLRVADASIVPLHVAAHLQSTVYGIAEKLASLIKSDA